MANNLLSYEVADLCLGKPALKFLSATATAADALAALRTSPENCVSVWSCDHAGGECVCIGKISMVDIICFLCREENLTSPRAALKSPVSALLKNTKRVNVIRHVEPSSCIVEAIDLLVQGAQNLVVPIKTGRRKSTSISPTTHNGREFCWLTQEDVIRFLLNSIGHFSRIPTLSISELGIISTEFLTTRYHSRASLSAGDILTALSDQTSVAVVDDDGILIGEISPFTLACCDETVAAAITTLTAGDLMAFIDCGGPPEDIVRVVTARLKERSLTEMLEEFTIDKSYVTPANSSSSSSSDEDLPVPKRRHLIRSSSYSSRMVRRAEAIVCHPWSSLVAVMMQAIAHRVNYLWVVEDDWRLVGIVTFPNILELFREQLDPMV